MYHTKMPNDLVFDSEENAQTLQISLFKKYSSSKW